MTSQDKLAIGLTLFAVFFVSAFLLIPASAYRDYFADLKRRKRGGIVRALIAVVFALALPYFYDELIGLDSHAMSLSLQLAMGACVYLLLFDVAYFAYKNLGPPARRRRQKRR